MKKFVLFTALVVLILVAIILYREIKKDTSVPVNTISYTLESKKLQLLVADNDEERVKGLMHYRSLPDNVDGMIFMFPFKSSQSFWNKNTYLDLDVYWVDGETVVGKDTLPSIEKSKEFVYISSPQPVDKVIELAR